MSSQNKAVKLKHLYSERDSTDNRSCKTTMERLDDRSDCASETEMIRLGL